MLVLLDHSLRPLSIEDPIEFEQSFLHLELLSLELARTINILSVDRHGFQNVLKMGLFPLDFRQVVCLLFLFETRSTNLFMTIDLKMTDSAHIVMPDHILVTLPRHNTN